MKLRILSLCNTFSLVFCAAWVGMFYFRDQANYSANWYLLSLMFLIHCSMILVMWHIGTKEVVEHRITKRVIKDVGVGNQKPIKSKNPANFKEVIVVK